jgi:hypothetical protein
VEAVMGTDSYPAWLTSVAIVSLAIAAACFVIIAIDILRGHKQHMWIMNIVWPITALYGSVVALYFYFTVGRLSTHQAMIAAKKQGETPPGKQKPFWQMTTVAATHCGSGCTLGDIVAEWGMVIFPFTLFGEKIFGAWVVDFVLAFLFGVAFQYFTIVPMKQLPKGKGLWAAVKADSLSLTSWQVGMYGWMAIVVFAIFGHEIQKTNPIFWFMMQIAMWLGFLTSYPVNWWLLKKGIKEKM